ncbi:MAG: 30S ribosomal protein S1 [Firmicutes bacterium]|nr:30S ribosomal protein S1 [Bacillota bacterium]NLL87475.1 30S ribosomal protein S1 [Bacillota bacterium]HKM17646.1 30S ribosomal protein S1 [Limnochordia bacterium]
MSEFTDEKVLVNGPADQEEPKQETAALETEMETVEQEASEAGVNSVAGAQPEADSPGEEPGVEAETDISEPALTPQEPVAEDEAETGEPEPGAATEGAREESTDPPEAQEPAEDVSEQIMEEYSDVPTPVPNTIVTGRVVQVGSDEVLVDIGYKSEGRIPLNEMGLKPNQQPADVFAEDMEIDVWILKVDDAEDNVVLSKRRADMHKAWSELERLHAAGEPITAEVTQVVKGGLLVDLGVRGFIPASHVSRNYVDKLDKYVGQTMKLKIIELDRQKNNVVLSRKEVLEEEYQKAKEEVFDRLEENMIVEGVVQRITDFGAFVNVGNGIEGLLHVSEMAHSRVKHPSSVVSEGDRIKVMVLSLDKEEERISLGLKQTLPDPWESIEERYHVGDKVSGEVTRTVDFGAFVKLEDGVEGLIHISQLSHRHVAKTEDVVKAGDQVEVKVINVDREAKRIGLSLRELEPKPEASKEAKKQEKVEEAPADEELTTNIGDMFGDLFKNQ